MEGPMDRLFGHSAFDLNHDGKIDAAEWALINDTFFEDENGISSGSSVDEDDDVLDELEMAGIDRDEFDLMSPREKRETLEEAGFDVDDFDDDDLSDDFGDDFGDDF